MFIRISAALAAGLLICACDRGVPSVTTAPTAMDSTGSAATSLAATTNHQSGVGRTEVLVNMQDNCDPQTFNAALGAGTCAGPGGLQLDNFLAMLRRLGFVGPWHFSPSQANVVVGQKFVAINKGGEEHTFTEVEEFGGGVIPLLNQLSGNPVETRECAALEEEDRVAPGGRYEEEITEAGTMKVQCCIHPWMRLEARVSPR